ncbi:11669_t:CDS:2, partial [Dentiscutata heterogama]
YGVKNFDFSHPIMEKLGLLRKTVMSDLQYVWQNRIVDIAAQILADLLNR